MELLWIELFNRGYSTKYVLKQHQKFEKAPFPTFAIGNLPSWSFLFWLRWDSLLEWNNAPLSCSFCVELGGKLDLRPWAPSILWTNCSIVFFDFEDEAMLNSPSCCFLSSDWRFKFATTPAILSAFLSLLVTCTETENVKITICYEGKKGRGTTWLTVKLQMSSHCTKVKHNTNMMFQINILIIFNLWSDHVV